MIIIVIIFMLFLLFLFIMMSFYYYKLIKRFISFMNKEKLLKKYKKLFILLSIIFTLLSFIVFNMIGIFFMHFLFISLLVDLIYLCLKRFIKNKKIVSIYKSSLIPFLLTIIVLLYGVFNIKNIVETNYTIYTDKEIGEELEILFIADSHYGDVFKKKELNKVKKRLDNVDADIVIIGGDVVDEATSKEDMEYIFSVFGDIKNKYGIYYVYGNHDRQLYSNKPRYSEMELINTIKKNNINILDDSYIAFKDNFVIAGRDDFSVGRSSLKEVLKDVSKDDYLIMVDHQPLNYDENVENDVDLIVSGHTHGGQIFPVELFIKLLHTADLSYGYKDYKGLDAIVTSGLVGWGYPIRTSHHSEYVVINIKEK